MSWKCTCQFIKESPWQVTCHGLSDRQDQGNYSEHVSLFAIAGQILGNGQVSSLKKQADLEDIDMKLALADIIVQKRKAQKMTQAKLAEAIGSSQSRIAKVEHGDPSVSLELMMKALIGLGSSRQEIGRAIG
ncbi:MAG: helix-turn-helix domain-containing protein [Desulfovibrionales bacterium]|nr:MAG: helix-turn-helix domain-containing protein [Desulfovibrionales bacterium]